MHCNVESIEPDTNGVKIYGWAYVIGQKTKGNQIKLVLQAEDTQFLLDAAPIIRPDVSTFFNNPDLSYSGFVQYIPRAKFKPRQYKLGVLIKNADMNAFILTDKVVSF